jgi:hypothetical protein
MRSLIVAFCLAALPTFAAADLASEGRDCYHAGDIVCATDKLLAHYQATGDNMEGRDGRATTTARMLIQSLIIMADNTPAGASLSRIEAAIDHVNRNEPRTVWFRVALHTLRAEQCAASGNAICAAQSRQILNQNGRTWLMPDLHNSRMQSEFNRRVLAQM